nr:MAG TPA: capsid scaffolding protein [Caudoviricetes sp.]
MKKKRLLMPMKLQFFAEQDGGSQETTSTETTETTTDETKKEETGKTFSRDELAKIVAAETKKARASWEQEAEAKKEEAKKLAKMNAEEKLQHELEQKEAEIAELKRGQTINEMKSEASKMLSGAGLPQDDEILGLIVSEDAEATKKAVAVITNFASRIKKENARQSTPGEGGQFSADKNTKQTVAELAAKNRIIK